MEDIADVDYMHVKEFVKTLKKKNVVNIIICILKVIHYFWLMFSKTSENCVRIRLQNWLSPVKLLSASGLAWAVALKKDWNNIRIINRYWCY